MLWLAVATTCISSFVFEDVKNCKRNHANHHQNVDAADEVLKIVDHAGNPLVDAAST